MTEETRRPVIPMQVEMFSPKCQDTATLRILTALYQGESFFRLRNVNIVSFYYLFNCATCFGHTTIFNILFSNRYMFRSYDHFQAEMYIFPPEDRHKTETCSGY
jgi:hypothetical protein